METKEGTKNLLTQPLCDNVQEEEEASESKKNDDIPAELRNDLDKLQIESDDTALKAPTSLREETND